MTPGGKVLIIDDELETTEIFAKMLRLHGYDVSTALDAESGFQAAMSTPFDAVVLDLIMPAVDGLAWLRRFRAAPRMEATDASRLVRDLIVRGGFPVSRSRYSLAFYWVIAASGSRRVGDSTETFDQRHAVGAGVFPYVV